MKTLLLLDAMNILNRNFFGYPSLNAKDGTPTGAIVGFVRTMRELKNKYPDAHIIVCSDVSRNTFRRQLYPDYKAQRGPTDPDLKAQIGLMEEYLKLCNATFIKKVGFEADDLIGTLAKAGKARGYKVYMVSGDQDIMQLVEEDIYHIYINKDGYNVYTPADVSARIGGLAPSQLIQIKALSGDVSDNYKGVEKVGDKSAIKLLTLYKSLDGIYANIDKLKGKQKEYLIRDKDNAYLCEQLATIKCDVDIDLDALFTENPNFHFCTQAAYDYLRSYQINVYYKADIQPKSGVKVSPTSSIPLAKAEPVDTPTQSNYNDMNDNAPCVTNAMGLVSCISYGEGNEQATLDMNVLMPTPSEGKVKDTLLNDKVRSIALPCDICDTDDEFIFRSLKYTGEITKEALAILLYSLEKCPELQSLKQALVHKGEEILTVENLY